MLRSLPSLSASIALCLAGGCLMALPRPASAQEVLEGIAAVVNKEVITFGQVRDLVGAKERAAREALKGQPLVDKVKEIRLSALNDLIDRQLILQEFATMKTKGYNIPPHVIDEHVESIIREQFGNDRSAFIRTLSAQGYTMDRFRQMEEEKIIVSAMRSQHIGGTGVTPEGAIQAYYHQHVEDYTSEEQIKLRMLSMKKGSSSEDNRRKMMGEIRQKIIGGAAFSDLARMYSEDESRQEAGGDWGWINKKVLNEGLTKIAFALKPGEISQVLEVSGNYYLLYCEAKKGAVTKPYAEVRGDIEKTLAQQSRQKAQEEWLAKLRKKAFVKIY